MQDREGWKGRYRSLYDILWSDPRILDRSLTSKIGSDARMMLREAVELKYIVGPQIRKSSCQNLREYMYFVKCKNPELLYLKYREDQNVIYQVKTAGFCDLFVISRKLIDIDEQILVEGQRSDYYVSHPPDHSWETAIEIIKKKIEISDMKDLKPQRFIQERFDKLAEWDLEDETLYRYFKYDLRKPLSPLMRDQNLPRNKIYSFLERLPETCTIFTDYYPDSISAYNPYLFMFETDYEDFIIDLFSELPATSSFFKVSDKLFANICVPEKLSRINSENPFELCIPLLTLNLHERGILRDRDYVIPEYYWSKDL